jgi:hypothetical protein
VLPQLPTCVKGAEGDYRRIAPRDAAGCHLGVVRPWTFWPGWGRAFWTLALLRLCVGDCAHRKSPVSQLGIAVVNPEWASAIDRSPFSICSMSCDRRAVDAAHQQTSRRRPIRHCDVLVAMQGRGRRVGDCRLRGPAIKKAPDSDATHPFSGEKDNPLRDLQQLA